MLNYDVLYHGFITLVADDVVFNRLLLFVYANIAFYGNYAIMCRDDGIHETYICSRHLGAKIGTFCQNSRKITWNVSLNYYPATHILMAYRRAFNMQATKIMLIRRPQRSDKPS